MSSGALIAEYCEPFGGVPLDRATFFMTAARSPEAEVRGSTNKCATDLYPSYNAKVLDQCVDVCIRCNRGTTTPCPPSCTLKGARQQSKKTAAPRRSLFGNRSL